MGASLLRLFTMRASALVLLAVASVQCDSDAYTIGQVAYGAGYGGVVTGIDYGYGHVAGYGAIGNRGFYGKREADSDAYTIGQVAYGLPIHNAYATGHPHNVGVVTGVGYGHYGHYGKREAEPYTIGQVAHGLPVAHAIASGRAHNVGVITGVSYGHGLGYGHVGGFYGKREAEPYTIGQVAYGLPVHNAVATGHAHNVGVVTGYGHGLGYGYAGHFYG
eukprot:TRINITY_DN1191_c0_g1_i12.p1 TRINITY_DN1191_c0_g1~~TRINITY_DN1191_c0_g1_i12.p1  ORF type:complete len:247 (+),score=108.05 TRINITY_DN1191_c0_g1_i12:87-743(+)